MWINFRYRNWGEKARNHWNGCVRRSTQKRFQVLYYIRPVFVRICCAYPAVFSQLTCVYLNIKSGESGGSWQVRHAQITWMLAFGFGASNCSVSLQKNNWETLWRPSQHIVCPRVLLTTITSEFQRVLEPSSNEKNIKRTLSVHCLKFTGKKLLTWATSIGEGGVCLKNWA